MLLISYVPGVVALLFKPRVSNPVEFHIADSDIAVTLTAGGFNTGISGFTGLNSTVSGT